MNENPCCPHFIKSVMFQLLKVLVYLHSKNIMHRDIKPSNVLVSQVDLSPEKISGALELKELANQRTEEYKSFEPANEQENSKKDCNNVDQIENKKNANESNTYCRPDFVLKLIDFGVSKQYERGEKSFSPNGDPDIQAPEIELEGIYDEKVDIWGVGLILLGLSLGKEIGNFELQKYRKGIYPQILSEKGLDLLDRLLEIESIKRISGEEAVRHEWFKEES